MPTVLSTEAVDGSTYVVTATFTDADGESLVPNSVNWSLYDWAGNIVNERDGETETPAAAVDIVLSGDDLDYEDGSVRILQVWGTYDSSLGTNLPYTDSARISIANLRNG